MIVFAGELIGMMRHFMVGMSLDADALALEVIHAAGPGGDFLTARHTLRHFRELWQPTLFDRRRTEDWLAAGGKRLGERLRERTVAIIDAHRPEPLPAQVRDQIDAILKSG
jgi:trimethylamine--corrinoid protein Co-methyltransferase